MKFLPAPRLRRAALAAVAVVALAGCSHASPLAVAYVGDAELTQPQFQQALDGLSSTLQEGQTVSSEAVLNAMIQGMLADQIATDRGIQLTDAELDKALASTDLAPLAKVPAAREVVYDVADSLVVAQKLGEQDFLSEVKNRKVTLNPRYGVLDPAQKTLLSGRTGSLSEPAAGVPEAP